MAGAPGSEDDGFINEYASNICKCAARSELKKLDAQKIVPGDIIELQAGNSVPADARVISTASLQVDQSSLTGETVPESKTVEYKSRRR